MVIKVLVDLYERLLQQKLVSPSGWDKIKISYLVILKPDGTVKELKDVRESVTRGKKTILVPRLMELPSAVVRSNGKKSNFLWDNSSYVFGYEQGKMEKAELCFRAMRRKHRLVLDGCHSAEAKALLAFFDTWSSLGIETDPIWSQRLETLNGPYNFAFALEGTDDEYSLIAENEEIQKAWNDYCDSLSKSDTAVYATCSVTGREKQKIAVIHPKIKGILGADASGCALVCYNVKSVCSYGLDGEQAINSYISEYAAMAYAKALNWLLSHQNHRSNFGDVTVVYWSKDNDMAYGKFFENALNPSNYSTGNVEKAANDAGANDSGDRNDSLLNLNEVIKGIKEGKSFLWDGHRFDYDKPFYVLGLGSSGSRASVRFSYESSFGDILENIYKHQERMLVDRPPKVVSVPLWQLLKTAVRPKREIPSVTIDSLFRSILHDSPYPPAIYRNILHRVFLDKDTQKGKDSVTKINYVKTGLIKAYLLKNCNNRWEELDGMSLNEECSKKSYLLGRLFAVLEGIQMKAMPTVNMTIKDKFFNSACATPAITFPVIIKLSNAHLRKLNKPLAVYFNKKRSELIDRIHMDKNDVGFPIRLNPEEQGAFILGYYQERQSVFNNKKKSNTTEESENKED